MIGHPGWIDYKNTDVNGQFVKEVMPIDYLIIHLHITTVNTNSTLYTLVLQDWNRLVKNSVGSATNWKETSLSSYS